MHERDEKCINILIRIFSREKGCRWEHNIKMDVKEVGCMWIGSSG
jgi:hypothetical protein